jgi:hypothetical protein
MPTNTFAESVRSKVSINSRPVWHARFLALLRDIGRHAQFAFRHWPGERRKEVLQVALASGARAPITARFASRSIPGPEEVGIGGQRRLWRLRR